VQNFSSNISGRGPINPPLKYGPANTNRAVVTKDVSLSVRDFIFHFYSHNLEQKKNIATQFQYHFLPTVDLPTNSSQQYVYINSIEQVLMTVTHSDTNTIFSCCCCSSLVSLSASAICIASLSVLSTADTHQHHARVQWN